MLGKLRKPFFWSKPLCATMRRKFAKTIAKWSTDKSLEWRKSFRWQRQDKKFIKEYMPKFTEDLPKECRRIVTLIVGLLHSGKLNKPMSNLRE